MKKEDLDHYEKCEHCGQWFDRRDLARVLEHLHCPGVNPQAAEGIKGVEIEPFTRKPFCPN